MVRIFFSKASSSARCGPGMYCSISVWVVVVVIAASGQVAGGKVGRWQVEKWVTRREEIKETMRRDKPNAVQRHA